MNRIIITIATVAATLTACNGNKTAGPALTTDSVTFDKKDKMVEVTIEADYPNGGNPQLTNAIAEYISEGMGGTYEGSLTVGDSLVAYYGNKSYEDIKNEAEEFWTDDMPPMALIQTFSKTHETDRYVTYTASSYTFTGGAHGLTVTWGTTFRKSDGRRLGSEILRDTGSDDFHLLLKEGLREYFAGLGEEVATDEALKECLMTDAGIDYLPLPQSAPYLTEDGVAFIYQSYEIAPYAAGHPTFVVPYDKMKPYLTVTARRLVE